MTTARRRRVDVIGALAGVAVLVAGGVVAHHTALSSFERQLFRDVNGLTDVVRAPVVVVMQLGSLAAVVLVTGLALLARRRWMALGVALAGVTAWWTAGVAKRVVGRPRPAGLLHDVVVRGERLVGNGYPSGHAAVAAAITAAAVPYLPRPARVAAWTAVAVVGFARVYVGAHLPLDVVGGAALGLTIGSVVNLVLGTHLPPARVP